jgi:hypothetical protein
VRKPLANASGINARLTSLSNPFFDYRVPVKRVGYHLWIHVTLF